MVTFPLGVGRSRKDGHSDQFSWIGINDLCFLQYFNAVSLAAGGALVLFSCSTLTLLVWQLEGHWFCKNLLRLFIKFSFEGRGHSWNMSGKEH